MILTLKREPSNETCTFGKLYVDGVYFCETLEDPVRAVKIKGVTAVSAGTYEIILNWSNRFRRFLPLLLNTPDFIGVRIHSGNFHHDTEGCILVGEKRARNSITNSRAAFSRLFQKIDKAIRKGKVHIVIENAKVASSAGAGAAAPRV